MQPYMAKRTSTEANENPKATSKALKNNECLHKWSIFFWDHTIVFNLTFTKPHCLQTPFHQEPYKTRQLHSRCPKQKALVVYTNTSGSSPFHDNNWFPHTRNQKKTLVVFQVSLRSDAKWTKKGDRYKIFVKLSLRFSVSDSRSCFWCGNFPMTSIFIFPNCL